MRSSARHSIAIALTFGLAGATLPAAAIDRVALEYGSAADNDIDRYGANLAWDWGVEWFRTGNWFLSGYTEVGLNVWDSEKGNTGTDTLVDGHITPVFRWQRDLSSGLPVFLEFGVGVHGYSESKIENQDVGIPFAFGSHLGGGLRFGPEGKFEVIYRYQHQSNAGLGDKNPGIDYHLVNFGYRF